MTSISYIVPAYNEEKNIKNTLSELLGLKKDFPNLIFEIIVINDGSIDHTEEIIKKNFKKNKLVSYYKNNHNLGLGETLKKGISLAKNEKFIFIPGDNDLSKEILKKLLSSINDADIIMTYFMNDDIRGKTRFLISSLFTLIYLFTFDIFIKYVNGPAIYPTRLLKKLTLKSKRFSIVAEINIKMLKLGCSFKEIPTLRLRGLEGSTALSFKSFFEVVYIFGHLVFDINLLNRKKYRKKGKRVI
jgi:glycosyltransferase involved in cell wall biosynthesis